MRGAGRVLVQQGQGSGGSREQGAEVCNVGVGRNHAHMRAGESEWIVKHESVLSLRADGYLEGEGGSGNTKDKPSEQVVGVAHLAGAAVSQAIYICQLA